MENKIGILTFQNTTNYGAVLQTYALQHFFQKSSGMQVEVINYLNKAVTERESPVNFSSIRGLKQLIKFLLNHRPEVRKTKNVKLFCQHHIKYSRQVYLEDSNPDFSEYYAILTGSDQIWNLFLTNGDTKYMLDGYKGKGYSYAASIGQENILTPKALNAIRNLRMISVRETIAKNELHQLNIDAELVCDPTFLLSKEEWYHLLPTTTKVRGKYILLYQMTSSENIYKFAKELAKKKGATLINANPISLQIFKSKCIRDASPLEWLSLIKNAECVVTNSFHGLAFSINFEKEFYTEIRANEAKNSSRITSLLNILGLDDRNIASPSFEFGSIDYASISPKLNDFRDKSFDFLDRIIKDINND